MSIPYTLRHHGAIDGVTGSCHQLLLADGRSILVDCGLFQGAETSADGAVAGQPSIGFPVQDIRALVLTHVPQRLEFKSFLGLLHDRYGFVIGDQEGRPWVQAGSADTQEFKRNARRLEERLSSLGLAERLSDACAYVLSAGGIRA